MTFAIENKGHVVLAVIGDAAISLGLAFEARNHDDDYKQVTMLNFAYVLPEANVTTVDFNMHIF